MPRTEKKKCKHCGKSIRAMGTSRKDGGNGYDDWSGREYHKKCYKEVCRLEAMNIFL